MNTTQANHSIMQFYNEILRPGLDGLFQFLDAYPQILIVGGMVVAVLMILSMIKKQIRRLALYTVMMSVCLVLSNPLWGFFCEFWKVLTQIRPYIRHVMGLA